MNCFSLSTNILITLLLLNSICPPFATPADNGASLFRGSSLYAEDHESNILSSSGGTFSCGFKEVATNAFTFSIWFTNSANKTVVWSANRDHPFVASDQLMFKASDWGPGIQRRLTLDYDGNLRLYSLDESSGTWSISWVALSQPCNVHGLCGRNGICVYSPKPSCTCPPGYEMNQPSDWSKGCKRKFNISCVDSHN
uniref:non-specific serine/threonine protein kinase n=1 Tax=Ananas comosus var. bracteatus TaxID=296719 RepID=A0A6V7NU26_ANACO|nr:unnamed protein product [Ananas comosus var. bracteatus]